MFRPGSGSSVIVPRSESFSQVAEYQIGLFPPKLKVLMVELNVFLIKKHLVCNYICILYTKLELCESNTLNLIENCPIWYSANWLKDSERGTITKLYQKLNKIRILYLFPNSFLVLKIYTP